MNKQEIATKLLELEDQVSNLYANEINPLKDQYENILVKELLEYFKDRKFDFSLYYDDKTFSCILNTQDLEAIRQLDVVSTYKNPSDFGIYSDDIVIHIHDDEIFFKFITNKYPYPTLYDSRHLKREIRTTKAKLDQLYDSAKKTGISINEI